MSAMSLPMSSALVSPEQLRQLEMLQRFQQSAPLDLAGIDAMPNIPTVPGAGLEAAGAGAAGFGGMSLPQGIGLGLAGLQTIGGLWSAFQAQKLAKKQFQYTKKVTDTNLTNEIKSFNTALEDRIRSRAHTEGRPDGYADSYLSKHKLDDYKAG